MSPRPEIKGWCPTAYQPMESGDGLLIRAKTIGARIDAAQLSAIAHIAKTMGNGLIDLSQRAQLQIRGVQPSTLTAALNALDAAGLLAGNADVERITNILAPPLAGLDTSAAFDAHALVADLAAALAHDSTLYALPAKFLFAVVDDGTMTLDASEADISFYPATGGGIALRLAGVEDSAVIVAPEEAVAVALRLAKAFIELRAASPFDLRRMRKLIAATGVAALIERAGVSLSAFPSPMTITPSEHLGLQDGDDVIFAGVAAPSGRWRAQELALLAEEAAAHGLGEARLTPWRSILIPAPHRDAAAKIIARAAASGLIVASDDPRRSIVACPGAPECLQAQGETRIHLERLAPLARQYAGKDGVGLHLSGCGKGCARQGATPITLVLADGRFNLVVNGGAQDAPIRAGLALEDIEPTLTLNVRNMAPCPAK
jgi:precorrin-3B synthase